MAPDLDDDAVPFPKGSVARSEPERVAIDLDPDRDMPGR